MSSTVVNRYPPPYEFQMRRPSRWAWFTRAGRAQRLLWRAQALREDARRRGALIKTVERLAPGRISVVGRRCRTWFARVCCIWSGRVSSTGICPMPASGWPELQVECPAAPEKLSLRWQLVRALLAARQSCRICHTITGIDGG